MEPLTFIFIGRSGCGKGTQVDLLKKYIKENDASKRQMYHLETGSRFREFVTGDSYSSKLSNTIYMRGDRQPNFLAVWVWSHLLVENLKGGEHIILDGTPRDLDETKILKTALGFYSREKVYAVHLDVSREWSEKHLLARGRFDDVTDEIKTRLDWYDRDVVPAVDWLRAEPLVKFLDINGEQPIEKVHQDLIAAVFQK